jgi:hypothetical protein
VCVVLVKCRSVQGKACLASDLEEIEFSGIVPVQIMIDQKQPDNVEYCNYLGIMVTNYARCTRAIKSRIAMAKAAFNKEKTFRQ